MVKGLVDQKQLARHRKALKPTDAGMQLYDLLLAACPDLLDPGRTAVWEILFARVEKGEISAEKAVEQILADTQRSIRVIMQSPVRISLGATENPTPAMVGALEAAARAHGVEKQLAFARSLAHRAGTELPEDALADARALSAWIDGARTTSPPSEKQLALAARLAAEHEVEIPDDILASATRLSAWIDTHLGGRTLARRSAARRARRRA